MSEQPPKLNIRAEIKRLSKKGISDSNIVTHFKILEKRNKVKYDVDKDTVKAALNNSHSISKLQEQSRVSGGKLRSGGRGGKVQDLIDQEKKINDLLKK